MLMMDCQKLGFNLMWLLSYTYFRAIRKKHQGKFLLTNKMPDDIAETIMSSEEFSVLFCLYRIISSLVLLMFQLYDGFLSHFKILLSINLL